MAGLDNIAAYYSNYASTTRNSGLTASNATSSGTVQNDSMDAYGLDMSDFLTLMVAQFTNQTMDNTADISDMLNQLVQMQMVTALNSMSTAMETMTDQSIMSYAASLVGKEVTVAGYDSDGNYGEIVGTVTATGSYGGEQVVFIDDNMYYMTQIIAVGRLPNANSGSSGSSGSTDDTTNGIVGGTTGTGGTLDSSGGTIGDIGDIGDIEDSTGSTEDTDNVEDSGATETTPAPDNTGDTSTDTTTDSVINSGITESRPDAEDTGDDAAEEVEDSGVTETTPNTDSGDAATKRDDSGIAEEHGGEN